MDSKNKWIKKKDAKFNAHDAASKTNISLSYYKSQCEWVPKSKSGLMYSATLAVQIYYNVASAELTYGQDFLKNIRSYDNSDSNLVDMLSSASASDVQK